MNVNQNERVKRSGASSHQDAAFHTDIRIRVECEARSGVFIRVLLRNVKRGVDGIDQVYWMIFKMHSLRRAGVLQVEELL